MGAGSQSRCNRLLPGVGFRDRSRHKGVHCVRDGYSLEMPARIAPITALVQAMQASVYAWSSICRLFCPALRRGGVKVDAFKLGGVGHFQVHHSGIWNALMLPV